MIYLIGSMCNFIVGNNEIARFEQNNKGMVAKFGLNMMMFSTMKTQYPSNQVEAPKSETECQN